MERFNNMRSFICTLIALTLYLSPASATITAFRGKLKQIEGGSVLLIQPGLLSEETLPLLGAPTDKLIKLDGLSVEITGEIIHLKGRSIALRVKTLKPLN